MALAEFLRKQETAIAGDAVIPCIVLGNESCDIDSAVCSISLAFFLVHSGQYELAVPVMNIPRADLPLRNDLKCLLDDRGIDPKWLTFRDDFAHEVVEDVVLVDHNQLTEADSPFKDKLRLIVDHHQDSDPTRKCAAVIEMVASCATLVIEFIHSKDKNFLSQFPEVGRLLLTAIVVDSVNFDPDVRKTTPKDLSMIEVVRSSLSECEPFLQFTALFERISFWKNDVDSLSTFDLLRKDLKIVRVNGLTICINALTLPLEYLADRRDINDAISEMCLRFSADMFIQMTQFPHPETKRMSRQLLLHSLREDLFKHVTEALVANSHPDLQLTPIPPMTLKDCICFNQANIPANRKIVLPLVRDIVSRFKP